MPRVQGNQLCFDDFGQVPEGAGDRPCIGQRCRYQGRAGQVRAIYLGVDGLVVVGRFDDAGDDGNGFFVAPWADCEPPLGAV